MSSAGVADERRAVHLFSRRASVEAAAPKRSAILKYTLYRYSLMYSATVVFVTALATARDGVPLSINSVELL